MPTVRTRCPHCEVVTLSADMVLVRTRTDQQGSEAVFECPACRLSVIQAIEPRMVPVLIGAGCQVEEWSHADARALHPSAGAITESEIDEFVAALDRRDWQRFLEA